MSRRPPNLRGGRVLAAGAAALSLAACAQSARLVDPPAVVAAPSPATAPDLSARERTARAVRLLGGGERDQARAELQAALARQPRDPTARSLLDQIDKDPAELLGARSYAYRVKPGENLSGLAGRFLGDPLLFYALARYNGLPRPDDMAAGQVLRIPGAPRPSVPARPEPPAPAPAAPPPVRDPQGAHELRARALDHLNGGAVDRAVALLRKAQELDPQSAAIRRDLDRATRIQTALRRASPGG